MQLVTPINNKRPLFNTFNIALYMISAVHQPFIFRFVFKHCLDTGADLASNIGGWGGLGG